MLELEPGRKPTEEGTGEVGMVPTKNAIFIPGKKVNKRTSRWNLASGDTAIGVSSLLLYSRKANIAPYITSCIHTN